MIQVVNKLTGEVLELPDDSPADIKDAWLMLSETIKMLERAKEKLKPRARDLEGQDLGGYAFQVIPVQRMNYDKAVMRQVMDEDDMDLLLVPDKPRIDAFIRENLETLGDKATELRSSMVPVGEPYSTIRIEKLKGDIKNEVVGHKNSPSGL